MTTLRDATAVSACVLALVIGTGSCSSGPDHPTTNVSVSPSEQVSLSSSPSTPMPPSWQQAYNSQELSAYMQALQRYETYEQRSQPVWAAGQVTAAAKALFKEYFPSPAWQLVLERLRTFQQVDVQIAGIPKILWSKASSVSLTPAGAAVELILCVDATSVVTTQYGVKVEREAVFDRPLERRVSLQRASGGPWLIFDNAEPNAQTAKGCDPGEIR